MRYFGIVPTICRALKNAKSTPLLAWVTSWRAGAARCGVCDDGTQFCGQSGRPVLVGVFYGADFWWDIWAHVVAIPIGGARVEC